MESGDDNGKNGDRREKRKDYDWWKLVRWWIDNKGRRITDRKDDNRER